MSSDMASINFLRAEI